LKFCADCNFQIKYDNAKFCPECGNNFLIQNKNEPNDYSKGVKLESFVMNILKEQDFDDIKTRQKLLTILNNINSLIRLP